MKARGVPADPHRAKLRATLKDWVGPSWFGCRRACLFVIAQIRNWRERHARFKVSLPGRWCNVEAPIGMSVLEVSQNGAARPHVGLRRSRTMHNLSCPYCRAPPENYLMPAELEAAALRRIGAPD